MGEQSTPTPVPYKKLLPLAIIYFIEAFVFTNIFSYVGFMVLDFHLTTDPDKVGYYAGYIGSTFSVAGFLSSFWWGRISDRIGRRPVLIFGCFGGLVSTLLFGFSTSLEMAIATRFAAGILNGNVGVVKGYAADICDKTNQVKGVGVMQLGWGLGGIIGPLIGGILSRPCSGTFEGWCSSNSLFWKFPYLLPNLFSCVASLAAIITLFIYLPKNDEKKPIEMKRIGSNEFSINEDSETSTITDTDMTDYDDELSVEGSATLQLYSKEESRRKLAREDSMTTSTTDLLKEEGVETPKGGLRKRFSNRMAKIFDKDSIFGNRIAMLVVLSYSILGGSFTMYDEAFPLFAMTKIEEGGINATPSDIGIVGAINGAAAVIVQLVIFYPIATKLKFVRLYRLGLIIGVIVFCNYPNLNLVAENRKVLWVFLTLITILKVMSGQFAFSATTAMVSNACPMSQVGAMNGFAQSFVALLRAFSPAIAGNVLAWGFGSGYGFPLNQYLIFILISFGMSLSLFLTIFMPRALDYPYEDLKPAGEETNNAKEEKESMLHGSKDHVVDMKDARKELEFSVE